MRIRLYVAAILLGWSGGVGFAADEVEARTINDRLPYAFPERGAKLSRAEIKAICEHFDLRELWRKIERDPPPRPFSSDGCTGWVDQSQGHDLYPACFLHDLKYWAGYPGEEVERLVADAEFLMDLAHIMGSTAMAETMYAGVRLGGTEHLKATFSWGFGRRAP